LRESEKVVQYLRKNNKPNERILYRAVCDDVLRGDESNFWNVLAYLKESGLVRVWEVDQKTLSACYMRLTDKGSAFAQMEKERKAETRKNLIINFVVAIITVVVTHFVTKFLS